MFWPRVLDSVVIQLYAGECTPSVNQAYLAKFQSNSTSAKYGWNSG